MARSSRWNGKSIVAAGCWRSPTARSCSISRWSTPRDGRWPSASSHGSASSPGGSPSLKDHCYWENRRVHPRSSTWSRGSSPSAGLPSTWDFSACWPVWLEPRVWAAQARMPRPIPTAPPPTPRLWAPCSSAAAAWPPPGTCWKPTAAGGFPERRRRPADRQNRNHEGMASGNRPRNTRRSNHEIRGIDHERHDDRTTKYGESTTKYTTIEPRNTRSTRKNLPSARQLVRQDGGVTAPRAGRDRPGWPMAAHQLASAYRILRDLLPELVKGREGHCEL